MSTTTGQTHNHYIRCPQCERLERERDEARALLRECYPYVNMWPRGVEPLDALLARLDAALGGER